MGTLNYAIKFSNEINFIILVDLMTTPEMKNLEY